LDELKGTSILLVDDEPQLLEGLELILQKEGARVTTASSGEEGLEKLGKGSFDVVVTDVKMPGMSGLELLEEASGQTPAPVVVVVTGYGTIEQAVEAMSKGAYHYLTKPFNAQEIILTLERALRERRLADENRQLREEITQRYSFGSILYRSEAMRRICRLIEKVAPTRASILIQGESGTGKELIARAIHQHSPRRSSRFVAINTAALPESLLEAELFGYRKGAFTGADQDKSGLFQEASDGTLFLDEVGSMPATFQSKLLRVLQEGEIVPVGDTKLVRVDVRVIAATNIDLKKAAEDGQFRDDLYWRLNVIEVVVPPLRDRIEDIPLLANHFTERFCTEQGMEVKIISPEAMKILMTYGWPGNVRELENVIQRAVLISEDRIIGTSDIVLQSGTDFYQDKEGNLFDLPYHEAKARAQEIFQSRYVRLLLDRYNNNISLAARKSGITRAALYKILKNLGIDHTA
jgi:DNA-binding NtrC family response regulator